MDTIERDDEAEMEGKMTDRPIIFSGPMVRALLDGRKTQTRRVLKIPSWAQFKGWPEKIMDHQDLDGSLSWFARDTGCLARLPIPQPGDRLYVREAWRSCVSLDHQNGRQIGECASEAGYKAPWGPVFYEADGAVAMWPDCAFTDTVGRYRHARFMPRWASRLTLHVTDVRVQRLQDISSRDVLAEGVEPDLDVLRSIPHRPYQAGKQHDYHLAHTMAFRDLWNILHGPDAWDANDWVYACSFEMERRNIDSAGRMVPGVRE